MDDEGLENELLEKLPPDCINVDLERGVASYYDFHGVTFRETPEEHAYVNGYIQRVIEEKAGFPVRLTEEYDGNGHCSHHFVASGTGKTS